MKQGIRKRKAAKDVVEDGQFDIWNYRSKIAEILALPIVEVRRELAKQQPLLVEKLVERVSLQRNTAELKADLVVLTLH